MDYQLLLRQLYADFNARQIDPVLAHLHSDITWPNGWEGGYVTGHEEVRAYWLRQWQEIDPSVEPVSFETRADGSMAVEVHQIVKDLTGQVIGDTHLRHVYRFENGKVRRMDIELEV